MRCCSRTSTEGMKILSTKVLPMPPIVAPRKSFWIACLFHRFELRLDFRLAPHHFGVLPSDFGLVLFAGLANERRGKGFGELDSRAGLGF
jgi:hypothetical protein